MDNKELLKLAERAREQSYCPYSGISVGAALLTKSGKVYLGANIENSAFSPSVCAERVALFKAISEGEREFLAIAVAGGKDAGAAVADFSPCGVCRQVMSEFSDGELEVIWGTEKEMTVRTLRELIPDAFGKAHTAFGGGL